MKFSTFLVGVAIYSATSLFLVSCQKEEPTINEITGNENNARVSGFIFDDPAALNNVPMIVSSSLLKYGKEDPATNMYARGGKQDNTLPTVGITAPLNTATVSGIVNIQATASDNVKVSQVSFTIDGSLISNVSTSPYTLSWNSASVSNGAHTLMVTAKDPSGNSKSASIQVYCNNVSGSDITKPTINIIAPTNNATVYGTVNIQSSASDNVGISSVAYSVDGSVIGSSNTAPYNFSWNTTTISTGLHTLKATAKDATGNSADYSIQVTVNTVVIPPVTLPASYYLNMPPVGFQGNEFSCVAWAVATARSGERYYKTGSSVYDAASNIFSPEYIYNQAKFGIDCSSGTGISTCLNILKNQGVCTWQNMPYNTTECAILPNSTQIANAANYKIGSFAIVYQYDEVAIKTLLTQNHPLIAGTSIDDNFTYAKPGFIWNNFNSGYGTNHSYVICGYDDTKHAYKIINSWGVNWGDGGYTWIDYDFFGTLPGSVYVIQNAW